MKITEYQTAAEKTDQAPEVKDLKAMIIPLLGLVGESGSLMTEYKKYLRDGDASVSYTHLTLPTNREV